EFLEKPPAFRPLPVVTFCRAPRLAARHDGATVVAVGGTTRMEPRMNLFGMITTAESRDYTPLALRSFFARTRLDAVSHFVLIDNSGEFVLPGDVPAHRVTLVRPPEPQSFA